jgi:hypothetical protein
MISEIKKGERLVALLIDNNDIADGTHPITPSEWPLQALMMKRSRGHVFVKHTHAVLDRATANLQEVIIVTKGVVQVTVCERSGEDIGAYTVSSGQCLFLVDGGYKIEVVEDATFYEFKNGPHLDDKILL